MGLVAGLYLTRTFFVTAGYTRLLADRNDHRRLPGAARQGDPWWAIGPTFLALQFLAVLGVVRDLRPCPAPVRADTAAPTRREGTAMTPRRLARAVASVVSGVVLVAASLAGGLWLASRLNNDGGEASDQLIAAPAGPGIVHVHGLGVNLPTASSTPPPTPACTGSPTTAAPSASATPVPGHDGLHRRGSRQVPRQRRT